MKLKLPEKWTRLAPTQREMILFAVVAIFAAGLLGGLTTREQVGWKQLSGFALAISFYAIFALGLSLEFGFTGLLNLGHVGFMAIGAYTYGILLMSGGRPDDPAPIVGWLYDQTPKLIGNTVWGFLASLFAAILAATLVLVPLLLIVENAARNKTRAKRLVQGVVLLVGGAALAWGGMAVQPGGRGPFVATIILTLVFAGAVATVAGALLTLQQVVIAGLASRAAKLRAGIAIALAIVVGVAVFATAFPLDERGALAMGVLLSIALGMVIAALVALVLGLPAIKLREDYLAIVTLGFAEILRNIIINEERWTRGTQPIQQFPRPIATWASTTTWWREFANDLGVRPGDLALLTISVLVLAYVFVLLHALSESPWGRVLKAIREDEDAAAALGKPVSWFKLQALMIGSAIAALAGALFISEKALVSPGQYLPITTFYAFIIIVMGGIGNHKGAIIGSVILWTIFFGAQNAGLEGIGVEAGPSQLVFVGVVLIAVMMFRPQGLVGRKEELLFAK